MEKETLLNALRNNVIEIEEKVSQQLNPLKADQLNKKPAPGKWSALECLEHLNRYARYYIPELDAAIVKFPAREKKSSFEPGWLGNLFVKKIDPANRKPQKTLAHLDPAGSKLGKDTIEEFLEHQAKLLKIIAEAKNSELGKNAIGVEFFKPLKLKIGDMLRFLIAHERRHIAQALDALEKTAVASEVNP